MTNKGIVVYLVAGIFCMCSAVAWSENTLFGTSAGDSLTSGDGNAFFGGWAGFNNTTASYNVYVGIGSGDRLSSSYNVGIGYYSLFGDDMLCPAGTPCSGNRNTAVGYNAGQNITTGSENVFVGKRTGEANSSASNNVFVGNEAGLSNTTGEPNTFIGNVAGHLNTTGYRNTYIGNFTGAANVSGHHNIFIGDHSGENELGSNRLYIDPTNTAFPLIYGEFDNNKLVINGSLTVTGKIMTGIAGTGDTFLGEFAGQANTSGTNNTFLGTYAGGTNINGSSNTYLGQASGYQNKGSGNVFIGNGAGYSEQGSNRLIIDNFINGGVSPLIYGEFDNKIVKINGALIMTSDERSKKNIEPLQSSLDKVLHLRGVSYEWKELPQEGRGFGGSREIGLIAQEVEKALPEIVHTDSRGYKSVAYDKLVPVLIEGMKEQQKEIAERDERIAKLEKSLEELIRRVADIERPMKTVAFR